MSIQDDRFNESSFDETLSSLETIFSFISSIRGERLRLPRLAENPTPKERQAAIEELLEELCSTNPESLVMDSALTQDLRSFFERVYLDGAGFRHQYSRISHFVYEKVGTHEGAGELQRLMTDVPDELMNLRNGLDQIVEALRAERTNSEQDYVFRRKDPEACAETDKGRSEVIARVIKLYDHVSMEIERLQYQVRQNRESVQAAERLERAVEEKEEKLREFDLRLEDTKKDVQRDSIAVLGIFAAVVLVFNGGVSFSSASLDAIGLGSGVVPVLLMASIVGFVLVNTVGILLSFIWRMSLGKRVDLGKAPMLFWLATDAALVLIIAVLAATRLPCVRAFLGL